MHMIVQNDIKYMSNVHISEECKNLIEGLLSKNPEERIGMKGGVEEILDHEWFSNINV